MRGIGMTRKIHLLIALLILSSCFLIAESHSEAAPEAAEEKAAAKNTDVIPKSSKKGRL